MNSKVKIKFSLIVALVLALLISLGAFFGITFANATRTVTINGSSVFSTFEDASVWAHRVEVDEDNADYYTMFAFTKDSDAVRYQKNLAYTWYENTAELPEAAETEGEEGEETDTVLPEIEFSRNKGWFNMEIGFADDNLVSDSNPDGNVQFEKFVITFESQQYSQTKDGKTTNYIIFTPAGDGELNVYVTTKTADDKDLDAVLKDLPASIGTVAYDHIKIEFTAYDKGEYTVEFNDSFTGTFENVGKTYAKYSSSTTSPVLPLSFKAIFEEEDEDNPVAHGNAFMTLYNMNGQSFKFTNVTKSDGAVTNGTIDDNTPPVLCIDKQINYVQYNGELPFDYTVIDVITTSPYLDTARGAGVYYYMLKNDKAAPVFNAEGGDYFEVIDADDRYIFPRSEHYLPVSANYGNGLNNDSIEVKAAVKVVIKLTDTAGSNSQSTYILLDWYVDDNYLVNVDGTDYIAVATDKGGLSYNYNDNSTGKEVSNPDSDAWQALLEEYRGEVEEAAKDLMAGSKNYFYLPSVEKLFALENSSTPYEDLKFAIYYNNGSQQSNTNKSANELSINLTKAGTYIFTVYATDAAGNNMYYFDSDGEAVEFEMSDIWNMFIEEEDTEFENMKKYLPWFEFTVNYSEISIEEPDEQSTAYVGSSYTSDSFEINGVSVSTVYTLYEFENSLWADDHNGVALTYDEFLARKDELLSDYRKYFTKIRTTSELEEGTADYDKFNPYGWNGTSLTFTPQVANAFYLIKCEASSYDTAEPVSRTMAIAAAPKVAPIKGEDTWAQDNMVSIILLCIAGASFIGIILLLVIKPKNNGDLDEVSEPRKKTNKK